MLGRFLSVAANPSSAAMAVRDEAITTGTDKQGDMRKRTAGQVPQANTGYATKDVQEKTKEKVRSLEQLLWTFRPREGWISERSRLTAGFRRALLSTSWTIMSS